MDESMVGVISELVALGEAQNRANTKDELYKLYKEFLVCKNKIIEADKSDINTFELARCADGTSNYLTQIDNVMHGVEHYLKIELYKDYTKSKWTNGSDITNTLNELNIKDTLGDLITDADESVTEDIDDLIDSAISEFDNVTSDTVNSLLDLSNTIPNDTNSKSNIDEINLVLAEIVELTNTLKLYKS